ncbi:MAG: ABC transporter ATP-binding protein [Proteobacteria bacterium]|nr:ABC transporter ATP-binding protein [Pseudomonadota bacterium]
MSIIKIKKSRVQVALSFGEMRDIFRRFAPYARRHWFSYVLGIIATVILNATAVIQPYILKILTDRVLLPGREDYAALHLSLLALIGSGMLKGIFLYAQAYLMAYGNQSTIRDLRDDVYTHLQMLPLTWFDRARLGDIIVRLTDDIRIVMELVASGIIALMNDVIVAICSVTYMTYLSWRMTFLAFFLTPVTAWVIDRFDRSIESTVLRSQGKTSDLTSQVQETLSGVRVVKAFTQEDHEIARFEASSGEAASMAIRLARSVLMQSPVVEVISSLSLVIVIGYGAYAVSSKILTLGDFMAFWAYLLLASTPISRLSNTLSNLRRGLLAARRIFEIKDIHPEVHEAEGAPVLPPVCGHIRFENVVFGYDKSKPVLQGLDFTVEHGSLVAIVGHNGAGKSTLVALISRFYDPDEGVIRMDGHDIRLVALQSLRRQISFVLQENFLFSGTIRDNLKYGRHEATDDEMFEACRTAHCDAFIRTLPDGYDTRLVEGGRGLSGGQRQRIAIARALIANPRILILDEATASIDMESERDIQVALHRLLEGRTTFVIAHRLSTVRQADVILVMENGQIVESGSHEQLLALGGAYQQLHASFYGIPTLA